MNNIIEAIMKARAVARNEAIEANTVLINKEFGKVIPFSFDGQEIPPMICGLKAYISKDVPEELGFLMLKSKENEKDLVEVVHAKWVVKGQDVLCSHCNGESGYNAFGASSFSDHCPNCGARMDGE